MHPVQGLSDLFTISLHIDDVQDFDVRWAQVLLSVSETPSEVILEGFGCDEKYLQVQECGQRPAPTSKSQKEREFVVASGASMHMMRKQDLSSDELDTLRRSRTPTVVLTANGEVHTHKEARVFVHDLNLFVTVQLLEETLAVLSLGKLCEDHGYSYEWVSGQKPRLTKEGKTILCKTDNFVPLVVPGLSTISGSNSSPTSTSHDLSISPTKVVRITLKKTQIKNKKTDDNRDSDDRLRDLPECLEEFIENQEDTEVHAPAHNSHGSDSERPAKVASRKHSICTHFPKKTEITKSACEPK